MTMAESVHIGYMAVELIGAFGLFLGSMALRKRKAELDERERELDKVERWLDRRERKLEKTIDNMRIGRYNR